MPLSDGNLHEPYRRYTSLRCITSHIMQNSVRDLPARRRTAKVTYSTAKKFSELDGARNCVAGNHHVSRSDNQENNCAMSRITVDYFAQLVLTIVKRTVVFYYLRLKNVYCCKNAFM